MHDHRIRPANVSVIPNGLAGVVTLAGHRADMQIYYDCADIFVQPSIFEQHLINGDALVLAVSQVARNVL